MQKNLSMMLVHNYLVVGMTAAVMLFMKVGDQWLDMAAKLIRLDVLAILFSFMIMTVVNTIRDKSGRLSLYFMILILVILYVGLYSQLYRQLMYEPEAWFEHVAVAFFCTYGLGGRLYGMFKYVHASDRSKESARLFWELWIMLGMTGGWQVSVRPEIIPLIYFFLSLLRLYMARRDLMKA